MTLAQAVGWILAHGLTARKYSAGTLRNAVLAGELRATKFGKTYVVAANDLIDWLKDSKRGKPGAKPKAAGR